MPVYLFVLASVYVWANEPEALFFAASTGHVPGIERWLRGGDSPDVQDANGNSALHLAAENGFTDAARLLLEKGATVDLRNARSACARP